MDAASRLAGARPLALGGVLVLCLIALGCGDGAPTHTASDASISTRPPQPDHACAGLDDGAPCGRDLHCFEGNCLPDVCGDGLLSAGEACDDGNERAGDGCDPACHLERAGCGNAKLELDEECDDGNLIERDACSNRCTRNACGNDRLDRGEECDDGNSVDTDDCSNACTIVACRNGRVDPGEACDDGNTVDMGDGCTNACAISQCGNGKLEKYEDCDDGNRFDADACPNDCHDRVCGNGAVEPGELCEGPRLTREGNAFRYQSCGADCKHWLPEADDACLKCQRDKLTGCRNYRGVNVYDSCLVTVGQEAMDFGVDLNDPDFPNFIPKCASVVQCALEHDCWHDPVKGATGCYCGSASPDACTSLGPAADAPCVSEWQAASRSVAKEDVAARFGDFAYPSAWAFFVLECLQTSEADGMAQGCGGVCGK